LIPPFPLVQVLSLYPAVILQAIVISFINVYKMGEGINQPPLLVIS